MQSVEVSNPDQPLSEGRGEVATPNRFEQQLPAVRGGFREFRLIALLTSVSGLTGCIAAAVPLAVATYAAWMAVSGFFIFKTVQTSTGGDVTVQFQDGETGRVTSMPYSRSVAVWPRGKGEVIFADQLDASGYRVTTPGKVKVWLDDAEIASNTSLLTDRELKKAYDYVCEKSGAGQIHGASEGDISTKDNFWTFSKPTLNYLVELRAYSCATREEVWEDQMLLIAEIGSNPPSEGELFQIGATAWAEYVIELQAAGRKSGAVSKSSAPRASSATYDTQLVAQIQSALANEGLYTGVVDGRYGPNTRKAIEAYQEQLGLDVDGQPSKLLLKFIQR